jgi:hypothetical protein
MKKTKPTQGGRRKCTGAKSKYGEPTQNRTFRIPVYKMDEVVGIVNSKLKKYAEKQGGKIE